MRANLIREKSTVLKSFLAMNLILPELLSFILCSFSSGTIPNLPEVQETGSRISNGCGLVK